jgi:hypothetical protein
MKLVFRLTTAFLMLSLLGFSQRQVSLVPDKPSKAPDYFCTWNVQGYVTSYGPSDSLRRAMNENNMLGHGNYQNWVSFYPKIRKDLIFVMDDSWDIPLNENTKNCTSLGLVELNQQRFPSFTGTPTERLKKLTDVVKANGWKSLGGWICAQEAQIAGMVDPKAYWIERLKAANEAGFTYWKVDWGKQSRNYEWRKVLSDLSRIYAPNLVIEQALNENTITIGDTYRTYDVENVISLPVTIKRVANLLKYKAVGAAKGIINCEDEPYVAVGMGCAIGVMRHPFAGKLPDGKTDYAFPATCRDMKNRIDEVVRGIRWHRIAEPFGVGSDNYSIDTVTLKDNWVLAERETWNGGRKIGDTLTENAPARVSRGLSLPVVGTSAANRPYVLSSMYPNGAVAIATIGRALYREYKIERVKVEQKISGIDKPIGIFGDYESLTLVLPNKVKASDYKVLGQDLAGDVASDVTKSIIFKDNKITISGDVIRKVGLSAGTKGDISDPGLVLKFIKK